MSVLRDNAGQPLLDDLYFELEDDEREPAGGTIATGHVGIFTRKRYDELMAELEAERRAAEEAARPPPPPPPPRNKDGILGPFSLTKGGGMMGWQAFKK